MNNVELYIGGQRMDLYDDEGIQITDSLKDLRDLKKIFTPFSMPFTVPASSTNNTVFKHYYNPNITSGFDGRKYTSAEIRVGGIPYKKGSIILNDVKMSNLNPESYSLVFVGEGRGLTELFGDDKLSSLTGPNGIDKFTHDYSATNVVKGFAIGLNESAGSIVDGTGAGASIIYPLIYHAPDLGHTLEINATPKVVDGNGKDVYWPYLKPSLRVLDIIDAIEAKYGFTFSSDFFVNTNAAIDDLYLHLHNRKGQIVGGEELQEKEVDYTATTFSAFANATETQTVIPTVDIVAVTGSGDYTVQLIDECTGDIVMTRRGTGAGTYTTTLSAVERDYKFILRVSTEGGITTVDDYDFDVTERLVDSGGTTDTDTNLELAGSLTVISTVKITSQVPDITVIDFLTGIFQMFNLVAYYTAPTTIFVDTLDAYYADSTVEWDLSDYAHSDMHTVKRSQLFGKIEFGWKGNDSYLVTRRNEIIGAPSDKGYGYSYYYGNNDGFVYDGEDYIIDLPFEKMLFEQEEDTAGTFRNVLWGLYLDDDAEDPGTYKGAPLLFYARYLTLGASDPDIDLDNLSDVLATNGNIGNGNTYDDYFAPCNQNTEETYMINWDSEIQEFDASGVFAEETNSLFEEFYKTYIENMYDSSTRIFEIQATLPQKILTQYELNDRVILWGNKFKINSIDVDITTGEANLILITE